jgi:hypothetical protein
VSDPYVVLYEGILHMSDSRHVAAFDLDPQAVTIAADALADVLTDNFLASHIGPQLRCQEAEAMADLLRSLGRDREADKFLYAHSDGDDEPDDLHHDRYLFNRERG